MVKALATQEREQIPALLVSIKSAEAALNFNRQKIYRLINDKQLAACKVGRRTYIRAASLQKFADTLPAYQPKAKADEHAAAWGAFLA